MTPAHQLKPATEFGTAPNYELLFSAAFDNMVNFIRSTPSNIVNPGALQVRR
jgi:hypothetical protein